jgi:hypothetical protein
MKNKKLSTAVACAVCLAASVLLLGVSGTMAVGIVAWLRNGSALSGRNFAN